MLAPSPAISPNSGNILPFTQPGASASRAVQNFIAGRAGPVDIAEIAKRLAINNAPRRSIIDTIRTLHKGYGFPAPANPRILKGRLITGDRQIVWHSLWARDAVEAWFGSYHSPVNAALTDPLERQHTRNTLAARARLLTAAA